MTTHLIISDVQVRPGKDYSWLASIGNYIAETQPDTVINIGDFADMESLCSYDKGTKSFEGRRYTKDIQATEDAMYTMLAPVYKLRCRQKRNKHKVYNPNMVLTYGNHEHRITKCVESDPKIEGLISLKDLEYEEAGWKTIPFLKPIDIDGICYSHYFCSGSMGRPFSTAARMVGALHTSCVMGHTQNADICITQKTATGRPILGLFTGLSTVYPEDYLNPQTNESLRQIWVLEDIENGFAVPRAIPLNYLIGNYL